MDKERFPDNKSLILYFLKGSAGLFAAGWLFSCLLSVFNLTNPRIIEYVIDHVIAEKKMELLLPAVLLIVFIALLAAVCRYAFRYLNGKASEKFVCRMRDCLYEHMMQLPFSWYSENITGDMIQRCTSDVELVKNFLSEHMTNLVRIIVLIVLSVIFMSGISIPLMLISAAFIPVIVLFSYTFYSRISSSFRQVDEMEGYLSAVAQENLTGVRVVRAFGRERQEREKFTSFNEKYCGRWTHLMRLLSIFWACSDLISGLQVLTVVSVGAIFCIRGHILVGQYVQFVLYNAMLTWPVRILGRVISELGKAGISLERIRYIMNSEEEKDGEDLVEVSMDSDIVFDNVSFSYENEPTLRNVSFTIHPGETLGILGGTGSGKSTLMYLLEKLYPIEEGCGRITIDGVDINRIPRKYIRENIGMVLQEPYLFSGTIEENITLTSDENDPVLLSEATGTAMLTETIEKLSRGMETYVGERGVTLSGGQKQRVAIAQMLMRQPRIMVFDDSLSAVDAETDARIREALAKKSADNTVILISHRIASIMNADHIIVLDDGRIAEEGTHEQLVNAGGIYSRIFKLQTTI